MTTINEANITVKFIGALHQVFKTKQLTLKFEHSPKVKEIIDKLAETSAEANLSLIEPESNQIHPALLVLVNGKEISALRKTDTRVKDGDEVIFISVSHGG